MTRRIYLASPYRGDVEANKLYARRCQADSLGRGEAPFVPHLLYTQSLDDDIADERALGMAAALAWLPVCDAMVLYTDRGVSGGMEAEAREAERLGIPVELRSCPTGIDWVRKGRPDGHCEPYDTGVPSGDCMTDGHYLCARCRHADPAARAKLWRSGPR